MRSGSRWKRWITVSQQMWSGLLQSMHRPVTAQGVFRSRRMQLAGAAMARTRSAAAWRFRTILLYPAMMTTFLGPKQRAATRLALPSTL